MRYQKHNSIVEATQWLGPGDHPAVVQRGITWAIATPEGWTDVHPPDWIITPSESASFCVSNALFTNLYEPVAEQTTDAPPSAPGYPQIGRCPEDSRRLGRRLRHRSGNLPIVVNRF